MNFAHGMRLVTGGQVNDRTIRDAHELNSEAARLHASEQHYTPRELAKLWHVSDNTVRAWCDQEGGILVIDRPETRSKRGYKSIRIPESTARRIYQKHFEAAA